MFNQSEMNVPTGEISPLSSIEPSNYPLLSPDVISSADENCEKFVAFFLGDRVYCLSSKAVLEVVQPLPVVPLPNAPSLILGIAAFRGDVIAVINIKRILRLDESNVDGKQKLIVLRADPKQTQFAIPVDSMHGLVLIEPDSVVPDPEADPAVGMSFLLKNEGSILRPIETAFLCQILEKSIG